MASNMYLSIINNVSLVRLLCNVTVFFSLMPFGCNNSHHKEVEVSRQERINFYKNMSIQFCPITDYVVLETDKITIGFDISSPACVAHPNYVRDQSVLLLSIHFPLPPHLVPRLSCSYWLGDT